MRNSGSDQEKHAKAKIGTWMTQSQHIDRLCRWAEEERGRGSRKRSLSPTHATITSATCASYAFMHTCRGSVLVEKIACCRDAVSNLHAPLSSSNAHRSPLSAIEQNVKWIDAWINTSTLNTKPQTLNTKPQTLNNRAEHQMDMWFTGAFLAFHPPCAWTMVSRSSNILRFRKKMEGVTPCSQHNPLLTCSLSPSLLPSLPPSLSLFIFASPPFPSPPSQLHGLHTQHPLGKSNRLLCGVSSASTAVWGRAHRVSDAIYPSAAHAPSPSHVAHRPLMTTSSSIHTRPMPPLIPIAPTPFRLDCLLRYQLVASKHPVSITPEPCSHSRRHYGLCFVKLC